MMYVLSNNIKKIFSLLGVREIMDAFCCCWI